MDIQPLEPLDVLNVRLIDHFGLFEDGRPNWRLVWSTNETENRLSEFTPEGLQLVHPEVMLLKKYPLQQNRYILEHLVPTPGGRSDSVTKTSYEPLWTFEDHAGNPLPPDWDVMKLLITQVQINMLAGGKRPIEKQPYGMGNTAEELKMRSETLMKELFGNETSVTDALSLDSAVGFGVRKRNDWLN